MKITLDEHTKIYFHSDLQEKGLIKGAGVRAFKGEFKGRCHISSCSDGRQLAAQCFYIGARVVSVIDPSWGKKKKKKQEKEKKACRTMRSNNNCLPSPEWGGVEGRGGGGAGS